MGKARLVLLKEDRICIYLPGGGNVPTVRKSHIGAFNKSHNKFKLCWGVSQGQAAYPVI